MATYVLVAGAWHGSWCWSEIVPRLERAGHRVLTPDLHGMSGDERAVTEEPLRVWSDQIADLVTMQDNPVILVGHSRAGIVISEVAERVPERIERLIYLCAILLKDGQSVNDVGQQAENAEAFFAALTFHEDGTCTVKPPAVESFFYNATPKAFIHFARDRLVPEPVAAWMTPVHVTDARFGSVPRACIEALNDHAVPITMQRSMQEAVPVGITVQLDSDHSPFFSRPDELVRAIARASVPD